MFTLRHLILLVLQGTVPFRASQTHLDSVSANTQIIQDTRLYHLNLIVILLLLQQQQYYRLCLSIIPCGSSKVIIFFLSLWFLCCVLLSNVVVAISFLCWANLKLQNDQSQIGSFLFDFSLFCVYFVNLPLF